MRPTFAHEYVHAGCAASPALESYVVPNEEQATGTPVELAIKPRSAAIGLPVRDAHAVNKLFH
ncbi:hypothetical protein [Azospirillum sp.]|uniref:hypothetical protein n=1 Tax=Azospirillum sp. TaxID=34012 RepID=UPI003D70F15B